MHTHWYSLLSFFPLMSVFVGVGALTYTLAISQNATSAVSVAQLFMASFFLIFGAFKIMRWRGFVDAYQTYDLIAKHVRLYGWLYPLIEIGLGLAYLFSFELAITNTVTIVVMGVSALGVANELSKGSRIPCACLGTVFRVPMTYVTLFEDLLMAVMALGMLWVV